MPDNEEQEFRRAMRGPGVWRKSPDERFLELVQEGDEMAERIFGQSMGVYQVPFHDGQRNEWDEEERVLPANPEDRERYEARGFKFVRQTEAVDSPDPLAERATRAEVAELTNRVNQLKSSGMVTTEPRPDERTGPERHEIRESVEEKLAGSEKPKK